MTPPPARRLLVAALDLSAAAADDADGPLGRLPADEQGRCLVDTLLDRLLDHPAADCTDVAAFAHRRTEAGPEVHNLLPNADGKLTLPLAALRNLDPPSRGAFLPRRWLTPLPPAGDPDDGLTTAHWLTARWVAANPAGRPPVVVCCTAAAPPDPLTVQSVRALAANGSTRVVGFHLAPPADPDGPPPRSDFPSGEIVALLTDEADAEPAEEPPAAGPAFELVREFWVAKHGNDPHQWEDGYAVNAFAGRAAVADGASEGIFCRSWAALLAGEFVASPPPPAGLAGWVNGLRPRWRDGLDLPPHKWAARNKVNEVGAAATLLGLTVGPAGPDGSRPWRATAVGDACLFWVRDGRLRAAFPVAHDSQLTAAPALLRTKPGPCPAAVSAAGRCRPGDLFLLATDAVSGRLFREAADPAADLGRYADLAPDLWAAELSGLRAAGKLVNDDYTLMVLRVLGADAAPAGADEPRTVGGDGCEVPIPDRSGGGYDGA